MLIACLSSAYSWRWNLQPSQLSAYIDDSVLSTIGMIGRSQHTPMVFSREHICGWAIIIDPIDARPHATVSVAMLSPLY